MISLEVKYSKPHWEIVLGEGQSLDTDREILFRLILFQLVENHPQVVGGFYAVSNYLSLNFEEKQIQIKSITQIEVAKILRKVLLHQRYRGRSVFGKILRQWTVKKEGLWMFSETNELGRGSNNQNGNLRWFLPWRGGVSRNPQKWLRNMCTTPWSVLRVLTAIVCWQQTNHKMWKGLTTLWCLNNRRGRT